LSALNSQLGGDHLAIRADVSVKEDCDRIIADTINHFGRIDTLVCNAGYGLAKSMVDTTAEELAAIFATNVLGTTNPVHAAIPQMQKQEVRNGWRGQIMIVSSAVARRSLPYFGAYSATKAAQLSISESLRVELKSSQIAVTSVHPAGTQTEFFDLAGRNGGCVVPPPRKGEIRQTAETVASKMSDAIARPRPEVWPLPMVRLGISIGTFVPGLVDRALRNYRKEIDKPVMSPSGIENTAS
jgi:short-subunit dehydrogenase